MSFVTVGKEKSGNMDLYYEDHGTGKPGHEIRFSAAASLVRGTGPTARISSTYKKKGEAMSEEQRQQRALFRPRLPVPVFSVEAIHCP